MSVNSFHQDYFILQTLEKIFLEFFRKGPLAGLCLFFLLSFSMVSQAAVFNVDSPEDLPDSNPGDGLCRATNERCTLRAAIEEANLMNEKHTIVLNRARYTLSIKQNGRVSPLVIQAACTVGKVTCSIGSNKITIQGRGRSQTTIQLPDGEKGRLVYVAPNNVIELLELKLANGDLDVPRNAFNYPGGGGGGAIKIAHGAYAIINKSSLVNNEVRRDHGGAIHNAGTLYIRESTISDNKYVSEGPDGYGGALYHVGDYAGIADTVIENNEAIKGGGIYIGYTNLSGQGDHATPRMEIYRSIIRGNTAIQAGGGLYDAGSDTELSDVTVENNRVRQSRGDGFGGGGIYRAGTLVFYPVYGDSTDREEAGAAIFNDDVSGTYGCQACHVGFSSMSNNGRYTDFGLVSKILYSMPPSDPSICGIQCAIDVMSYLRQATIPYDLRPPDASWTSSWNGWRLLKINGAQFEGNTSPEGADHCKTYSAERIVTRVSETEVRVIPDGGRACSF